MLSTFYRRSCFHQGTSHPGMTPGQGDLVSTRSVPGLRQVTGGPGDCLRTLPFSEQGSFPQQCLGTKLFKKSALVPQQTCYARRRRFLLGLLRLYCHKTFPYKSEQTTKIQISEVWVSLQLYQYLRKHLTFPSYLRRTLKMPGKSRRECIHTGKLVCSILKKKKQQNKA